MNNGAERMKQLTLSAKQQVGMSIPKISPTWTLPEQRPKVSSLEFSELQAQSASEAAGISMNLRRRVCSRSTHIECILFLIRWENILNQILMIFFVLFQSFFCSTRGELTFKDAFFIFRQYWDENSFDDGRDLMNGSSGYFRRLPKCFIFVLQPPIKDNIRLTSRSDCFLTWDFKFFCEAL